MDTATRAVETARGAEAELRITRTPTEQLSVTSYFAARGYDVVGVGLDPRSPSTPSPSATRTPASRWSTPAASPPPPPPPHADPSARPVPSTSPGVSVWPMEHHPRPHRHVRQPALPRRHDVRRLGQPRPRRVRPDHPPRSTPGSTSSTPPTSTRGESEEIVGKAIEGPPRRRRPRHQGPRRDGRRPEHAATRGAGSSARSRTACGGSAPTGSTSTRCTAPSRTPTSTRRWVALTDLVRQARCGDRLLDVPRRADRRGAVGRRAPAASGSARAAAVLDLRARHRGVGAAHLRSATAWA